MDIYVLKDPNDNTVRYVGITRQPLKERLRLHIKQARLRKRDKRYLNSKDKWILYLLSMGKKPRIVALSRGLSEKNAVREEKKIIEIFRKIDEGGPLYNVDSGGEYNICKGENPWNKGLKGCYTSELKSIMKKNQPGRKDVFRFDTQGNFIDSWISLRTMCEELGLDRRTVMRCLNKEANYMSHKGFMFSHSRQDVPVYHNKSTDYSRGNSHFARPIYGVRNGVKIQFGSIIEAIEFSGISYPRLKKALNTGQSVSGYCWYYLKEKTNGSA